MNVNALMDMTYGMYVIGTKNDDKNVGCFVNTVTQITAENPIISVSINKKSFTNETIKKNKKFSVSILSEKTDSKVIGTFGFTSSRDNNKYENVIYRMIDEVPVLSEEICGYAICELIDVVDAETHDIFLARVIDAEKTSNNEPMTYSYYHKVIKGSAPKEAPTYVEEKEEENVMEEKNQYKCKICGYIHDENKSSTKFDELPDDWKCPICGRPKSDFEKI
ncbi:MAG: flavin reductase [Clostridia bacterium]|nr:flavin reductase [Clostridia bacterium]